MPDGFHDAPRPDRNPRHAIRENGPPKDFNPVPFIVVVATIEGLLLAGAVVGYQTGLVPLPVAMTAGVVAAAVAMTAIIVMISRVAAKKRAQLDALLQSRGLAPNFKPAKPDKRAAYAQIGEPASLAGGATAVRWCASGEVDGRPATVVEHVVVRSSGSTTSVTTTTAYSTPAPHDWPRVTLTRESLAHSLGALFGKKNELKVESKDFNDRWHIDLENATPENEDFALLLLTPEVQHWLTKTAGKLESWSIGRGAVTCMVQDATDENTIDAMLRRPVEFLEHLDPVLRDSAG